MSLEQLDQVLATAPPLPPDPKPVVTDELLLRRFIGPEAHHYMEIYYAAQAKNPARPLSAVRAWCWPAALLFLPWALYRKMWLFGGSMTMVGIVLTALFPPAGTPIGLCLAVVTGFISNRAYLQLAVRKVEKLKAISASEEELLERVQRAGGVSSFGAWFGAIVIVFASLAAFMTALTAGTH
jgi:hypothetical protein